MKRKSSGSLPLAIRAGWLFPALMVAACSSSPRLPEDPDVVAGTDAPGEALADVPGEAPADAPGEAPADAVDAVDEAVEWVLPPCYRACDRVTACGVEACQGYDWASAGRLYEDCFTACDDPWAASVLSAAGCPAVLAGPVGMLPGFPATCASDPCEGTCDTLAACILSECPGVDPSWTAGIASDCRNWCDAGTVATVADTPCPDLVAAICAADPAFEATCHPPPATCATDEACDAWGVKLSGCIVEHCAPNADAYGAGLEAVLGAFCRSDTDCPTAADVAAVLDPSATCASPGLDTLGHGAPFTALCEGTLGVAPAEVEVACERLAPCPGAEWLEGVPGCMGFLAIVDQAAQRVSCLAAAADCTGAYACLEGL